jgi:hypothetical protein
MYLFAKEAGALKPLAGSNPALSAKNIIFTTCFTIITYKLGLDFLKLHL